MRTILLPLTIMLAWGLQGQHLISGKVTDGKNPVPGANIYLKGNYDGTTSLEDGSFEFETEASGIQTLVVTFLSFEPLEIEMSVDSMQQLELRLREEVSSLDAVVLSAGTFSAGDNSKVTVLKPLDVVTTAGVAGDFIAALRTLPGTQTVGEDGRLFVRGGTAEESQIYIDGLRVFQPYAPTTNNLPTRARYSPFLFDGISFSTGGYSAEYGQALSSVLLLNTIDEPDQTKTDIALMSVGAGLGHTKKWERSSISLNANYINLWPYLQLIPNNETARFAEPYQSLGGEVVFRQQTGEGLLKFYSAYDNSRFEVLQLTLDSPLADRINLNNNNLYSNLSYEGSLGRGWTIYPGISLAYSKEDLGVNEQLILSEEKGMNLKLKLRKRFSNRFKLNFGADYLLQEDSEDLESSGEVFSTGVENRIFATYAEGEVLFSKRLALKAGVRGTATFLTREFKLSPRLALAYKWNDHSQVSFASGKFYQLPLMQYLRYDPDLSSESSEHYILNYQWTRPGYTFRAEAYYKDYEGLLKYDSEEPFPNSHYTNSGSGYSKGIDLFFRDNKSLSNLEYWISYSLIDTERDYQNFPHRATPDFVAAHSASLVTKYWVNGLRSQVGLTYSFSSGRPYEDPNTAGFLNERTKNYNNLSFNWAYLLDKQKILYFSVSNLLGHRNVFGYEYARNSDAAGNFSRRAVTPEADRFFFIGFFWTISQDRESNQLDNL